MRCSRKSVINYIIQNLRLTVYMKYKHTEIKHTKTNKIVDSIYMLIQHAYVKKNCEYFMVESYRVRRISEHKVAAERKGTIIVSLGPQRGRVE